VTNLVFDGTEVVGSRFNVLRSKNHFRRHQEWRVPFSCLALLDSFSTVPWASAAAIRFWRNRTRFRQYQRRRVPFSCFALPDTFSTVWRASGPVFMFCVTRLIYGGFEGVSSRFNDLRSQTRFPSYRGCRVPFSCFALPYSFLVILRVSGPIFMFCPLGNLFDGTVGVGSHFHVLRARTSLQQY
jgi:hypothetical protein